VGDLVDKLVAFYEGHQPSPWHGELPGDYRANLLKAIVGFEMEITRIEGKFKLGQNRSEEDQLRVINQLQNSGDSAAIALANFSEAYMNGTQ
jgi:transcriptional regulator